MGEREPHTGTFFTIRRKLATESNFVEIGSSGVKAFTDNTIPAGTTSATYRVRAQRGEATSNWSQQVAIQFSASGDSESSGLTLAA